MSDAELDLLAGTLLPGDDLFPSAGALGLASLLRERLAILAGVGAEDILPALESLSESGRIAAVEELEQARPELFDAFFMVLCLTYYGRVEVTAAIAASGLPYQPTLQPKGYVMEPFDPARDRPRQGRGYWLATDEVQPVALPPGLA